MPRHGAALIQWSKGTRIGPYYRKGCNSARNGAATMRPAGTKTTGAADRRQRPLQLYRVETHPWRLDQFVWTYGSVMGPSTWTSSPVLDESWALSSENFYPPKNHRAVVLSPPFSDWGVADSLSENTWSSDSLLEQSTPCNLVLELALSATVS